MHGKVFGLSWLWFRRGMRHELRLPLAALALAAAAAGGVALFSAQLTHTVDRAANGALGADLEVRANAPIPHSLTALAGHLGLETTPVTAFPTVAVAGENLKLASLRAVVAPYPLRGKIILRASPRAPAQTAAGVPPQGEVWASPTLIAALQTAVGGTLKLGRKSFRIAALVDRAPGAQLDLTGIAPLVLMNRSDLAATGLAGNQSRVAHELLLAGAPAALARFRTQAKPLLPKGAEVRDVSDVTPRVSAPLKNTRAFLALALLATLLISAAALVQSSRSYIEQQRPGAAILKTLGAGRGIVRTIYAFELLWLALAASVIGTIVGWGIARGLGALAARWFHLALVPASLWALAAAPIAVAILGLGFRLVPLLGLPRAPPALALRGGKGGRRFAAVNLIAAAAAIVALVFWQGANNPHLTLWTLGAAAALAVFIAAAGYTLLRILGAPGASLRPAWRYAITLLSRRAGRSLAELVAFGLALTVILLLTGVRHDLVASWQAALPANVPDLFVVNIQPDQRAGIKRLLARQGITDTRFYPMVKARLATVNGKPAAKWKKQLHSTHAKHLMERDQTLSMRAQMGRGSKIVAGHWWKPADRGKPFVSVEADWAHDLQVGIGDRLGFSIAGQKLTLTVASLRKVNWRSFEPNFFLVTPPATLADYPTNWITAVHTGGNPRIALSLVRNDPNLTTVNVGSIIAAVTELLRHAALALAAVFALAVLAAVLVLAAALAAGRAERVREIALMRVLGARRRLLATMLATEFMTLGAIAGLVAGLVAAGAGYALARWVFEIPAHFDGWLVLAGVLAGALGIGAIGLGATLGLTRSPPSLALRRGT
ncbi:MAG: ABC transporter permease [Gammaproteobacteria bacterium]